MHKLKPWVDTALKAMTKAAGLKEELARCSIVLHLQKQPCAEHREGAEAAHGPAAEMPNIYLLVGHLRLSPYRATCRRVTLGHTDEHGIMHFTCTENYCRIYEAVAKLQPALSVHGKWTATCYKVHDTRMPVVMLDPRHLQVRAIAGLESQQTCFPPVRKGSRRS